MGLGKERRSSVDDERKGSEHPFGRVEIGNRISLEAPSWLGVVCGGRTAGSGVPDERRVVGSRGVNGPGVCTRCRRENYSAGQLEK